ncbi:hypothetical protein [Anaerotignum sp.]|uniref:hypothetical protein n=1 Tax=Anaerotignum sp. TaxID=2039241 RepID=UPI0027152107|nr:hypothetical protein [Anaerotignum sp.]
MAYNYDGYLSFGTRIDESGFEKGVSNMKSLANLSSKAIASTISGTESKVALFTTSFTKELEKITNLALGLTNITEKSMNQRSIQVEKNMSQLEKTIGSISEASIQKAKKKAVSYRDLGALYLKYMKEGMDEETSAAISSMEWQVDSNVNAFVAANKKAAPQYRKAAQELMAVYKVALKDGADEAYKLVETKIEEITEKAQKQYNAIMEEKQRMEEKLSAYGDLFTFNVDGEVHLGKIDQQIEDLEKYSKILDELQEKGISQGLFDEVLGMGVEDGMDFGEELLSKSDDFFSEYSKTWEEKQELVREIAAKFYDKELESLDEDFTSQMNKALSDIPSLCQDVGVDAMEGVVNGMESKRSDAVATAKSIADAIIKELKRATETASPSKRAAREVGKPLTQGIIKGMNDAYNPQELQAYTDKMMLDIGNSQVKAAQNVSYLNTSSVVNSSTYNNGGDFVLKIEKMVNDGKGSVSSLLQEAEFYRKQKVSATGGA